MQLHKIFYILWNQKSIPWALQKTDDKCLLADIFIIKLPAFSRQFKKRQVLLQKVAVTIYLFCTLIPHSKITFKDFLSHMKSQLSFFIISSVQLAKKWRGKPSLPKSNTFLKFVGFALILWKTFPMGYFAVDFGRKFFTSKNPSCAPP